MKFQPRWTGLLFFRPGDLINVLVLQESGSQKKKKKSRQWGGIVLRRAKGILPSEVSRLLDNGKTSRAEQG